MSVPQIRARLSDQESELARKTAEASTLRANGRMTDAQVAENRAEVLRISIGYLRHRLGLQEARV